MKAPVSVNNAVNASRNASVVTVDDSGVATFGTISPTLPRQYTGNRALGTSSRNQAGSASPS